MKIALIDLLNIDYNDSLLKFPIPPHSLGLLSLAAICKRGGYDVKIFYPKVLFSNLTENSHESYTKNASATN